MRDFLRHPDRATHRGHRRGGHALLSLSGPSPADLPLLFSLSGRSCRASWSRCTADQVESFVWHPVVVCLMSRHRSSQGIARGISRLRPQRRGFLLTTGCSSTTRCQRAGRLIPQAHTLRINRPTALRKQNPHGPRPCAEAKLFASSRRWNCKPCAVEQRLKFVVLHPKCAISILLTTKGLGE